MYQFWPWHKIIWVSVKQEAGISLLDSFVGQLNRFVYLMYHFWP